jgi:hypothetical protein
MNTIFLKMSGSTEKDFFSENFLDILRKLNPTHQLTKIIEDVYINLEKEIKGKLFETSECQVFASDVMMIFGTKRSVMFHIKRIDSLDGVACFYQAEITPYPTLDLKSQEEVENIGKDVAEIIEV